MLGVTRARDEPRERAHGRRPPACARIPQLSTCDPSRIDLYVNPWPSAARAATGRRLHIVTGAPDVTYDARHARTTTNNGRDTMESDAV